MTKFKSGEWGGYGESNVYYYPANCGLRIVASMELDLSYEYDTTLLLQDVKTKSLWAVRDLGCSCPTPFEDIGSFADMSPIRSEAALENFVKTLPSREDEVYSDGEYSYSVSQKQEFLRKGRSALRKIRKDKEKS